MLMILLEDKIPFETVATHLKNEKAAPPIKVDNPARFQCHKMMFECKDLKNIILWSGFRIYSANGRSYLTDIQEHIVREIESKRILNWLDNDDFDLRCSSTPQIVAVTNAIDCNFSFVVDGSHRACAHWLKHYDFCGVLAYVMVNADIPNDPKVRNVIVRSRTNV